MTTQKFPYHPNRDLSGLYLGQGHDLFFRNTMMPYQGTKKNYRIPFRKRLLRAGKNLRTLPDLIFVPKRII
jgi:hypothetical protein